jgi:hypothetical protein
MHNARFIIRAHGVKPWSEDELVSLLRDIRLVLVKVVEKRRPKKRDIQKGQVQILTDFAVHYVDLKTPADGAEARKLGFFATENPFAPGTRAHARWEKESGIVRWTT